MARGAHWLATPLFFRGLPGDELGHRQAPERARAGPAQAAQGSSGLARAFWRGFVTNALNPKVALFVLAFLPQFTDPARGPVWQQILILGATFTLTGTLVTMAYGALAGLLRKSLASRMSLLNRVAGGMLALLAVRLVAD